jgi:hypothetical protein
MTKVMPEGGLEAGVRSQGQTKLITSGQEGTLPTNVFKASRFPGNAQIQVHHTDREKGGD